MNEFDFNTLPVRISTIKGKNIYHFKSTDDNIDHETVIAFGDEWSKFNSFSMEEITSIALKHYFDIVPKNYIKDKKLLDVGCGTGRWTKYVSQFAKTVDAVDPSRAIESAASLLTDCNNVRLSQVSVNDLPFDDNSFDFVFSLGVLHHIPDTALAMKQCVAKVKPGGYFLTYLYYNFDNRGITYKSVFQLSTLLRRVVCNLPSKLKDAICDVLAVIIYIPLVWSATFFKNIGLRSISKKIPLHFYIGKSFHIIRNDARDRFGTPLEQRFSKSEIRLMMDNAGLKEIYFSDNEPFWHVIGKK